MATMDWQTPLSASLGLLSTAAVHLFRALAWVLLNVVAVVPRYLYRAGAVVATPLTYPLYFLWRTLAFVLSPVWALGSACVGVVSWALELAVRFKYLYIFFATAALVGILTACVLHGTSNLLFTLLNIAPGSSSSSSYQYSRSSSSYQDKKAQMRLQDMDAGGGGDYYESAPKEEEYDDGDASSSSTDFDNLLSEPASRRIRSDHPLNNKLLEQAYRQARSTRLSPIRPSRRFRGLLAQTIHEESSESE
ncbi:hypothetical protein E8E14_010126 [Neopestalotiopsis sp. 37M]|nr:hypothetical protein E8E14_010126 [Neopestalotiopsis sp. 37M]